MGGGREVMVQEGHIRPGELGSSIGGVVSFVLVGVECE